MHKMDAPKAACAKSALNCEIIERVFSLGGALRPGDLRVILLRRVYDVVYARGIAALVVVAGIRVCGSGGL